MDNFIPYLLFDDHASQSANKDSLRLHQNSNSNSTLPRVGVEETTSTLHHNTEQVHEKKKINATTEEDKRRRHVERQVAYRKRKSLQRKEVETNLGIKVKEIDQLRQENARLAAEAHAKELMASLKDSIIQTLESWKVTAQTAISAFDVAKLQECVFSLESNKITESVMKLMISYCTPSLAFASTQSFKYRLACLRREIQNSKDDESRRMLEQKLSQVLQFRVRRGLISLLYYYILYYYVLLLTVWFL